jgi:hypothetical protein
MPLEPKMSSPPENNHFDFMRQMWSNMGFGLPGMTAPTMDADEIERRINDLKAVEGWLKINLSMLQMTIQGLEVQRAALSAVRAMSQGGGAEGANPFANPALWAWPFMPAADAPKADASPPPAATADETPQNSRKK